MSITFTLPSHDFPYWSDPKADVTPPVLIVGAGLSDPMVPLPGRLASDYAGRQEQIEKTLGIHTGFDFTPGKADDLYCWAGCCIAELMKLDGETEDLAKQRLVNAMGLLEDERFAANADVPLRGTTPRHRVLARLAREGCIHSMWSLNWDLWLEAAFEAVGLIRVNLAPYDVARGLPRSWTNAYQVWLPPSVPSNYKGSITLYKPHGCVRALGEQKNGTFRITAAELNAPAPIEVKNRLITELNGRPVCALGWGATEENLQLIFNECAEAKVLSGGLTVIGLNWNDGVKPTDRWHSRLASNFKQDESNTLCAVKGSGLGTTDDLMQWIQALRSLRRFEAVVQGLAPQDASSLQQFNTQIENFLIPVVRGGQFAWALSWFDTFFPVWSRLCFSSKALVFKNDGDVPTDALPLVRRDEHIPLNDTNVDRWDILSAAHMYCHLMSCDAVLQNELDFESYPGAFWHEMTRTLLIPIPMWGDVADISLAAIKPLIESRHWAGMSRVERVCMLQAKGGLIVEDVASARSRVSVWKQHFCSLMKLGTFARSGEIDDREMLDLAAYLQGRKDAI